MARPSSRGASVVYPRAEVRGGVAWHWAIPAGLSGAAGLWLACHHPIFPLAMPVLFIAAGLLCWTRPMAWLLLLPGLLPLIDLAPWTGWISFEEVDLLVLAVAAGGYLRLAAGAAPMGANGRPGGAMTPMARLGWALFAASVAWSMLRGFSDAGGFAFGWFQGYREPMNSLRLAKAFAEASLLLPLWRAARRQAPEAAARRLMLGLTLGLLAASLAALWERLAFTGLLNFSTDYRTTALFWEMHVGGAALDGFLALALPFAFNELLSARSGRRWLLAAGVIVLALYAGLTTFSRGVYLALPIGLLLSCALHLAQRSRGAASAVRGDLRGLWPCLTMALLYAVAAAWIFPTSGYRGLLALLGAAALLLPLATALGGVRPAEGLAGLALGLLLCALAAGGAWLLPKGPYAAYALGVVFTLAMLAAQRRQARRGGARVLVLGGYLWVLTGIALVCRHWGGDAALVRVLPLLAALMLAALILAWRGAVASGAGWRWQAAALGVMGLAGAVVAAFSGGPYMSDRFSTASGDLADRRAHWEQGLSMLETREQQLVGKGLGRYFDNYWLEGPANLRPGDYRLRDDGGRSVLALVAGRHEMGWGELLRIVQRVEPPQGSATVSFEARIAQPAILHVDVCQKHLLYDMGCLVKQFKLEPGSGGWQTVEAVLDGEPLSRGAWYVPRLVAFSISSETPDVRVELSQLSLRGADGRELLVNGDFERGLARWFFTSDRNHIPWHMKNLLLHVLFEQGALGLALWCGLLAAAFWRVTLGALRDEALAPPIAGALAGFAVVGLFDSLLDVPRLGILFYLLLAIALAQRAPDAGSPH